MADPNESEFDESQLLPSAAIRTLLTVTLLVYLAIVLLGPLSNPIGSEHLTLPLARQIRPVHQALFLGHGYRFFGPDPGPSHILEYRIRKKGSDENEVVYRFPDRQMHWPRLLYHRWFMLSETLYRECSTLPDSNDHRQAMVTIAQQIQSYRQNGEMPSMRQLVRDRDNRVRDYKVATQRRDELLQAIASQLLKRHSGDSIDLYLIERLIPRPVDIQSGVRLTDPRFLSEPRFIGSYDSDDFKSSEDGR